MSLFSRSPCHPYASCLSVPVRFGLVLGLLAFCMLGWGSRGPEARAQVVQRTGAHAVDGTVHDIEVGGSTVYLGGDFEVAGPRTGHAGLLDAATGTADLTFPEIGGASRDDVFAVAADERGGWYVGGNFETVDGVAQPQLIHVTASNTLDPAFNVTFGGSVTVTALGYDPANDVLFVGGNFSTVNGVTRTALAAVDGSTGDVLSGWDASPIREIGGIAEIESLLLVGPDLYLGGTFDEVAGETRTALAKVRAADGRLDTSFVADVSAAGAGIPDVRALAWRDSTLYIGGRFDGVGGTVRTNVAAVDDSTGAPRSWHPTGGANSTVEALVIASDTVYVGGAFTSIGGESRAGLAAVSLGGSVTSWNPDLQYTASIATPEVNALALGAGGPVLYAAGFFDRVGEATHVNLAQIQLVGGAATSSFEGSVVQFDPDPDPVEALALQGSQLLVGGDFEFVGGKRRDNLAAFDASGALLDTWASGVTRSGFVNEIEVYNGVVYVGGFFDTAYGASDPASDRDNLAAFDASDGRVEAWVPNADGIVEVLAVDRPGQIIYVGGSFSKIGIPIGQLGQPTRDNLASVEAVDPNSSAATFGRALDFDPDPNGRITAIAIDPDTTDRNVFVAGDFDALRIGEGEDEFEALRDQFAKLDQSGNLFDWNVPDGSNGTIYDLERVAGRLLVGGDFFSIGGVMREGLADLSPAADPSTGETAVGPWDPDLDGFVYDVEFSAVNNDVYVAGESFRNASSNELVAVDGTSGQLSTLQVNASGGGPNNALRAVALGGLNVHAGGEFSQVQVGGGTPRKTINFAVFEDGTLPVELADFTAGRDGERVLLAWTTASETNNAGFDVQRSVDGSAFETIGFREGVGTTTEAQFYRFADSDLPFEATSVRYRLRQRDLDGTTSLSAVQTITLAAPQQVALLPPFPNPSLEQTTVRYQLPEDGTVEIALYNVLGQQVATLARGEQAAGNRQITVDTSTLGSGVYFVRLQAQGQTVTEKIMVVR